MLAGVITQPHSPSGRVLAFLLIPNTTVRSTDTMDFSSHNKSPGRRRWNEEQEANLEVLSKYHLGVLYRSHFGVRFFFRLEKFLMSF